MNFACKGGKKFSHFSYHFLLSLLAKFLQTNPNGSWKQSKLPLSTQIPTQSKQESPLPASPTTQNAMFRNQRNKMLELMNEACLLYERLVRERGAEVVITMVLMEPTSILHLISSPRSTTVLRKRMGKQQKRVGFHQLFHFLGAPFRLLWLFL